MILDVLYNAANWPWPDIRDGVLHAEAEGFGTAWAYDHMSGSVFGGSRMLECFSLAGAMAAATSSIGVGTLVVNAATRPPAMTAVAAASVQEISGGRFVFGLGAGAAPGTRWAEEHDIVGLQLASKMAARHGRLIEVLDVCEAMWATDRDARWTGFPLPTPRPAVILGVNSAALAEVAARRCDGLNVRADHPDLAAIFAAARAAREASPRAGTALSLSVWARWTDEARDPSGELQAHLAALGGDRLILVR